MAGRLCSRDLGEGGRPAVAGGRIPSNPRRGGSRGAEGGDMEGGREEPRPMGVG